MLSVRSRAAKQSQNMGLDPIRRRFLPGFRAGICLRLPDHLPALAPRRSGEIQEVDSGSDDPPPLVNAIPGFDLHIEMPPLEYEEMAAMPRGEPSITIRERVAAAREVQARRYARRPGPAVNARMTSADLETSASLGEAERHLLGLAMDPVAALGARA